MAFALGEDRHQNIGAGHLFATGRLDVNHRALDHPLEAGGRFGIIIGIMHQVVEFGIDVLDQAAPQQVDIDIARAHHCGGVLIIEQRQQQMFERRVFLASLVCQRQRLVKRLFKTAGK